MEAQARGEVIIKISMMNHVQPPEQWNSMVQHVLKIDGQIEGKNSDGGFQPEWQIQVVEKPLVAVSCNQRHSHWQNRKKQTHR